MVCTYLKASFWTDASLGTSVRVSGEVGLNGVKALFGIDSQTTQNGGATCQSPNPPLKQAVLFYDSMSQPLGVHTLKITNEGGIFSLSLFEVFGDSETEATSISTSLSSSMASSSRIREASSTPTSTSPGTIFHTNTAPIEVGTSPSSTLPISPSLPQSFTAPPATSLSNSSPTAPSSAVASRIESGEFTSYTVSSYTEVSMMDGGTVTIVIQTTLAVPQTQSYHGPSQGTVAGAAVGGLVFIFLLITLGLWWWRWRRNRVRFLYGISNLDFGTSPHWVRARRGC